VRKQIPYFLFLIPLILLWQFLSAQEPVKTPLQKDDSLKIGTPAFYEPGLNFSALKPDLSELTDFTLKLTLPSFDFSGVVKNKWKVDYSINNHSFIFPFISIYFPFSGTVFNQAIYQATDKLKIGGNSFGINSFLHTPLPGIDAGNYDYRGMSVFMEYKISKNFRIGGSISVAGSPYQP
jgi:hypothetical protein